MTVYNKTAEEIVRDTLGRLPTFYKRSETSTNYGLSVGLTGEIKELTNQMQLLYQRLSVETSTGQFLDDIGKLFKLARITGEDDDSYRARIKAFFQAFSGGGTMDGIKDAVSLMTGIDTSYITIDELLTFKPQQFVASMEASESWTGTGVAADSTYFYQGSQGIRLTAGSGTTITAALTKSIDLEINFPSDNDYFRIWTYFDDNAKIDSVSLKFSDGATTAVGIINDSLLLVDGFLLFDKASFTNTSTIDWNSITSMNIEIISNAATYVTFDWMQFGAYDKSMIIDVDVAISGSVPTSIINSIQGIVEDAKAAGIYLDNITFSSQGSLFLTNLSKTNGGDSL